MAVTFPSGAGVPVVDMAGSQGARDAARSSGSACLWGRPRWSAMCGRDWVTVGHRRLPAPRGIRSGHLRIQSVVRAVTGELPAVLGAGLRPRMVRAEVVVVFRVARILVWQLDRPLYPVELCDAETVCEGCRLLRGFGEGGSAVSVTAAPLRDELVRPRRRM